jgi:hypothetical protein
MARLGRRITAMTIGAHSIIGGRSEARPYVTGAIEPRIRLTQPAILPGKGAGSRQSLVYRLVV